MSTVLYHHCRTLHLNGDTSKEHIVYTCSVHLGCETRRHETAEREKRTSHDGTGTFTKNGTKHKATQLWATIKWNDATKDDNERKYNGNVRAREMPNKWKCNIFFVHTQKWDILIVRAFMHEKKYYILFNTNFLFRFFFFVFHFLRSFVICVSLHFPLLGYSHETRSRFAGLVRCSGLYANFNAAAWRIVSSRPCHARILVKLLWTCYLFTRASTQ